MEADGAVIHIEYYQSGQNVFREFSGHVGCLAL